MMTNHRYILEKYNGTRTRYHCPKCDKNKVFSRYVDTETGEQLPSNVGRCNREDKCGYHYTPKQYFEDNSIKFDKPQLKRYYKPKEKIKPTSFIPVETFKQSLKNFDQNNFTNYLKNLFECEITNQLISRYFIATSKHWNGATVFWQIDILGKIRTGKIMLYNSDTGKRIKKPYNHINWVHKIIEQPEFNLQQCFFGEHLLQDNSKPIAIVESEKTAIIASQYLPSFIWLAVGSLNNLSEERCKVLKGRNVILFPDLNCFEKWSDKAKKLSHITKFIISDLLEKHATEAERKQGLDFADYLIRHDYRKFRPQQTETVQEIEQPEPQPIPKSEKGVKSEVVKKTFFSHTEPLPKVEATEIKQIEHVKEPQTLWNITELENYFKTITLPTEPIKLNQCTTITNVKNFIDSHIVIVKANNGKRFFLPYFERLLECKMILTNTHPNTQNKN